METEPDRKVTRQVQQSMEVITSDGKLIGYVTAVKKTLFHINRLIAPDIDLPYTDVDEIEGNTVHLTLAEHEIALMRSKPAMGPLSSHPHHGREK